MPMLFGKTCSCQMRSNWRAVKLAASRSHFDGLLFNTFQKQLTYVAGRSASPLMVLVVVSYHERCHQGVSWTRFHGYVFMRIYDFLWQVSTIIFGQITKRNRSACSMCSIYSGIHRVSMIWSGCAAALVSLTVRQEVRGADFIPLGYLPGGYFSSSASDVSADGNVVVGRSHSGIAGTEAFRWTRSEGMVGLGDFPEADAWSSATAVSGDGGAIVGRGTAVLYAGVDGFRWTADTGLELIGYFPRDGALFTYPGAISHDGKVVVGSSDNRAFKWTEQDGISEIPGISNLQGSSGAGGVSADGTVIVGFRELNGLLQPYRYSEPNQVEDLGLLAGLQVDTIPNGLSSNGEVVIGWARRQGWRWDETTGMEALPLLPDHDFAIFPVDMTSDGSTIVGVTTASTDPVARFPSFIWTRGRGTENLETFLREQHGLFLDGWTLSRVSGISGDGRVIVGGGVNPEGHLEAWVVDLRVPEPGAFITMMLGVLSVGVMQRSITQHSRF